MNNYIEAYANGYKGILYGLSSMSIYKDNKEIFHTGFRTIDTKEELIKFLEGLDDLLESLKQAYERAGV